MPTIAQVLKQNDLFASFSEEELTLLAQYCEELRFPKGSLIFSEGQQDDGAVYLVQDGVIKIAKGEAENRVVLAMFGEGNIFGEMSFLDSGPRSATATTDEDSVVLKLLPEKFFEYGAHAPKAAMKMFKVFLAKLVKRLRETDAALVNRHKKFVTS